jgi:hypothetical protein
VLVGREMTAVAATAEGMPAVGEIAGTAWFSAAQAERTSPKKKTVSHFAIIWVDFFS